MAGNLTGQVRNIAEVSTAIARGDLSRKITVDVKGEILQLKETINTMVDQLNGFAAEVTRVAREVGTEGRLGGQATVPGVAGTWKDLTDNVNVMANNLTSQVRGIVKVVTAVATGDLRQRLSIESRGEVAALGDTINSMTATLATFADQVTTVAREVGRRRPARRPGARARCGRHVERPHREREPARGEPDQPGARNRRRRDGRDEGRPDAVDSGAGARRSG
jgi:HAMP domain-containing protein